MAHCVAASLHVELMMACPVIPLGAEFIEPALAPTASADTTAIPIINRTLLAFGLID